MKGKLNLLRKSMDDNKVIYKIRKFLLSKTFIAIQCLIGAVCIIMRDLPCFAHLEKYTLLGVGMIICVCLTSFALIFCDDIIATLSPVLVCCCMAIQCYNSFDFFIKFIWLAPVPILSVLFHFFVYKEKFDPGKTWKGILAVSIAITLGGLGKITAAEYFNGSSVYHTLGLGFGMLLVYFIMNSHYRATSEHYVLRFHFSHIMTLIGSFCVFMIVYHYAINWSTFISTLTPLDFQWRNNVSTFLMLTMPFAFFLSTRKYPYIFLGILQFVAILFTGSRGGALGAAAELALCLFAVVYTDVRNRKKTLIMIAIAVVTVILLSIKYFESFFLPVIFRVESVNIRAGLMSRAIEDFLSNVLFGRGLGYMGNSDVHDPAKFALCWYHSAPFQVIGSFGLLGVFCFTYQFINRMKVVWKRPTHFNITLFISYAGLFLMSLVNPGEFCPLPYGLLATLTFIICDKNNIAAELCSDSDKESAVDLRLHR